MLVTGVIRHGVTYRKMFIQPGWFVLAYPCYLCIFGLGGGGGWGKSPALAEEIAGEQLMCWRWEDTWRCTACQCLGIRSVRGSAGMELMHQEIAFSIFVDEIQLT